MPQYSYQARRYLVKLRRVARLWPWAISVAVHVAVLAGLSAFVFVSFTPSSDKSQIVPQARLGQVTAELPLFHHHVPRQVQPDQLLKRQFAEHLAPQIDPGLVRGEKLDLIALDRSDPPDAQSIDLEIARPTAPVTSFFNACGNAYVVVYVVDRSGSMVDAIGPLKRELKRSFAQLQPMQKFHVIFFSAGVPVEGPAHNVTWASERNKRYYCEFVDSITAEGKTQPVDAVNRALQLDPDLVYLLTDGIFSKETAERIIQQAKQRRIKINTIAYIVQRGGHILRSIAEQTGGTYSFISEGQLGW